jgi:adenylate kinase
VREGTEFGQKAGELMDAGELLPDDVIVGIIDERLDRDDTRTRGYILDGFPRTTTQAEELLRITAPRGIDLAINLEVPRDLVLHRLASRRVCVDCGTNYSAEEHPKYGTTCDVCGGDVVQREDDTHDSIARRLDLYERETQPLINWFEERDLIVTVDGLGHPDEVTARLVAVVDSHRRP